MPSVFGTIHVYSSILAVIFLLFGLLLWVKGDDRRGKHMVLGSVFILILLAVAGPIVQYVFGVPTSSLEPEPLVVGVTPTAVSDPQFIKLVAIKYVDNDITINVEFFDGKDLITKTITIDKGMKITTIDSLNAFPDDDAWVESPDGTYENATGYVKITYTYDGRTYSRTFQLTAYRAKGFAVADNTFTRIFVVLLNMMISFLGKLMTSIFVIVLDPTIALLYMTTLPPVTLFETASGDYVIQVLYGKMFYIAVNILPIALILDAVYRAYNGDDFTEVFIDLAIAAIWITGALQFYHYFSQLMNSIILTVGVDGIYGVGSMMNKILGSLVLFGLLGFLSTTFGFYTIVMIFAFALLSGLAVLRFLSIAAVVILQPLYAVLWVIPWTRGSLMGGVRYLLLQSMTGLALAIILTLATYMGGVVMYVMPIMVTFSPWAIQNIAQGIISGVGREGIAISQTAFGIQRYTAPLRGLTGAAIGSTMGGKPPGGGAGGVGGVTLPVTQATPIGEKPISTPKTGTSLAFQGWNEVAREIKERMSSARTPSEKVRAITAAGSTLIGYGLAKMIRKPKPEHAAEFFAGMDAAIGQYGIKPVFSKVSAKAYGVIGAHGEVLKQRVLTKKSTSPFLAEKIKISGGVLASKPTIREQTTHFRDWKEIAKKKEAEFLSRTNMILARYYRTPVKGIGGDSDKDNYPDEGEMLHHLDMIEDEEL